MAVEALETVWHLSTCAPGICEGPRTAPGLLLGSVPSPVLPTPMAGLQAVVPSAGLLEAGAHEPVLCTPQTIRTPCHGRHLWVSPLILRSSLGPLSLPGLQGGSAAGDGVEHLPGQTPGLNNRHLKILPHLSTHRPLAQGCSGSGLPLQ